MPKTTTTSGGDFIHFEGISFNKREIIAISGPSVELDANGKVKEQDPFFTVHLSHGVKWRIGAPTEEQLAKRRQQLVDLLG